MDDFKKLTPELLMSEEMLYLIRVDGVELAFVNSEHIAKLAIDSLAASEVNKLENDTTKVYRRDQKDGKKINISTQSVGVILNGKVTTVKRIDYIPIKRAVLLHGRHERDCEENLTEILSKLRTEYEKYVSDSSE